LRILFLIPSAHASQCMCTFSTTAITGGFNKKKEKKKTKNPHISLCSMEHGTDAVSGGQMQTTRL
jgi:hypothetical protein